ncbi:hypothetical protein K470DRAFT_273462 [Piedraia hortae CBS 480.64]|uniref:Uncharacterized protein n=1 Tax=Piedraia hortae CBS 480.64 TaxID=1314780 RepID=A0A6A7BR36_9PEZI|nr:hypothetical protein K470DRAFT_273462 [Piedraia hortae CBS 480.64]
MSGVRDPAFWKRFSLAVHRFEEDEEKGPKGERDSQTWLAKQRRKKSRRRYVCPLFWLTLFLFIAALIALIIVILRSGVVGRLPWGIGQVLDPPKGSAAAENSQ